MANEKNLLPNRKELIINDGVAILLLKKLNNGKYAINHKIKSKENFILEMINKKGWEIVNEERIEI